MPLLTRLLSPAAYGEAALVATAISLCSVVALAGIDMGYSRHWISGQHGTPDGVESFCWRWALGASLIVAAVSAAPLYLLWPGESPLRHVFVAFFGVGLVASVLATMVQTHARLREQYPKLALTQLVAALTSAGTTLLCAWLWRADAVPLLVGASVGYLLPVLLLRGPGVRRLLRSSHLSSAQRRGLLTLGSAGVLTAPSYWFISSADRWFLARYFDADTVGVYSLGAVVGTLGLVVSTAVTGAFLPELARSEAAGFPDGGNGHLPQVDPGRAEHFMLALLAGVALLVTAVGGELIRALADIRFHGAGGLVPWFALGILYHGCMHLGMARMVMAGRLPFVAASWLPGVLVCYALNVTALPKFGPVAAALAQTLCFALVMALVWWQVQRVRPIRIRWPVVACNGMVTIAAAPALGLPWGIGPWGAMATKGAVAAALALLLLWLADRNAVFRLLSRRG
jgi:O-antigen/teichoic acid export membrane protein